MQPEYRTPVSKFARSWRLVFVQPDAFPRLPVGSRAELFVLYVAYTDGAKVRGCLHVSNFNYRNCTPEFQYQLRPNSNGSDWHNHVYRKSGRGFMPGPRD